MKSGRKKRNLAKQKMTRRKFNEDFSAVRWLAGFESRGGKRNLSKQKNDVTTIRRFLRTYRNLEPGVGWRVLSSRLEKARSRHTRSRQRIFERKPFPIASLPNFDFEFSFPAHFSPSQSRMSTMMMMTTRPISSPNLTNSPNSARPSRN